MGDLKDKIAENAEGPARASGDSGSVDQQSLTEQIEADKYLNADKAMSKPTKGLRFIKFVPPGTV